MSANVTATRSPALGLIAPFFLVAPLGLVAAGLLLAGANRDSFIAVNLPRNVAVTHAIVIGWLTTTMMGAVYQLAPAVIGGPLWSLRMARVQLLLHVCAVPLFVWALPGWHLIWMSIGGTALYLSLTLFALNAAFSLRRGSRWSLPRAYVAASIGFLAVTMTVGITYLGALQPAHAWFGITLGRVSAHAHLGLVGWLALTVMGVGYQLVPMFNLVKQPAPRFGWAVLAVTAGATLVFAATLPFDPPPAVRPILAALLAAGPALWGVDQVLLMHRRARRRVDIQGRATWLAVAFLAVAIPLVLAASLGNPLTTPDEPARWLLAYAAAGLLGWMGSTLIGNSYKILSFLIWYHRYRPLVGREPVPVAAEIYSEQAATAVLAANAAGAALLVVAALSGRLELLHTGGLVLAGAGAAHAVTMAVMFLPRTARRAAVASTTRRVPS